MIQVVTHQMDYTKQSLTDFKLSEALVSSRVKTIIGNRLMWTRAQARGISQLDVDFFRKFMPGTIPGHNSLNESKVYLLLIW